MEQQQQIQETRTAPHSGQTYQIAGLTNGRKRTGCHRDCIKHRNQLSLHDVRLLKVKTDQREIGEASGKQRACYKISPVSSRQISRRQRVSGACFQFVRPRVKKPRQDQDPETQQGWSKQETKTRLIPVIKVKD